MNIEILQNDSSVDHQRKLVAEALPELEQFIIIGRRAEGSEKLRNFASCSFSEPDLANAVANFLIGHPQAIKPFVIGSRAAIHHMAQVAKNEKV
ncbi:MAG: hypothetical protein K2H17_05995 [Duncaniella sp.]|uniref:hypothetical protein n=1 Tax=Duncaniella sp. TaxID=2518496 RepID=UPI0023C4D102|nr:hypothetical protein [Duncaniella sp.]MDE5988930.1 hypothetical protein [Duncaniella sp.]